MNQPPPSLTGIAVSTHLDVAALDAARAAPAERAVQREVDVLLGIHADHERRHVHNLLPNTANGTDERET